MLTTIQFIQIILLIITLINSTIIGYLITKNKINIAISLGIIQSLIIGGNNFINITKNDKN